MPSKSSKKKAEAASAASQPQTPGGTSLLDNIAAQLSLNSDDISVDITSGPSGTYAISPSAYPTGPSANSVVSGPQLAGSSPGLGADTPRYTPPFARGDKKDDVFQTTTPSRRQVELTTPPGGSRSRKDMINRSTNWRSGSSDDDQSHSSPTLNRGVARRLSFSDDNLMSLVRANDTQDAQGLYLPSCCVFVANLQQNEGEEALQMAVTQVFREFGPVFVKIRRDVKQMPFAFCQYTTPEHANRAILEGRGRLIKGRACRCEKARANRLFFLERKYDPPVSSQEARQLLAAYGRVEFCYTPGYVERTALNVGDGVLVQFLMYDDGQNAQSALRHHDTWKLIPVAGMASPPARRVPSMASDTARAYLSRYETDRRSIFVGNLPAGITRSDVTRIFDRFGKVEEVQVRESLSKFEPYERVCFAFVQFEVDSVIAVSHILGTKTEFRCAGRVLRISQKDSEKGASKRTARTSHETPAVVESHAYASPTSVNHPSPVNGQAGSPMPMAPPGYGMAPYGYTPFPTPFSYYPGNMYSDGYNYYQPQSYGYYPYPAYPTYDANAAPNTPVANSPSAAPYYYGYPPYQYAPQVWGSGSAAATQQYGSPSAHPAATFDNSPPVVSSTEADARSPAATPADQGVATEDVSESQ